MTTVPLISCVVPAYNGERYLGEALNSLLAQTHPALDVIVVDDGSTDGTSEIAGGFGPPVRLVRQSNAGPAAAINRGFEAVRGEFVAVLAADDLWPVDRLERQLERFRRRPELDISLGHLANFWVKELAEEEGRFTDHRLSKPIPGHTVATMLARRSALEAVGHLDPGQRHAFSTEWFLRVQQHGLVVEMLDDILLHRRMHPENRSRLHAGRSRSEYLDLLKRSLDQQRQRGAS
jgi:glycosyltransferase involved in cell wall biosynthesis